MSHVTFQVAEYIRLSREDGDKAESDSIGNQRKLIGEYLREKEGFVLYDIYIDDGFTGTNFNRPSFQRMIEDIETGKVNCVIVKDLSRFGRDYIDTGKYLERYFPEHGVRFISITDSIDSFQQAYDMLLPIKNIFNEQYARDISRKVHASMETKQRAGEFIGSFASYGYRKSPTDKNKLILDLYAAGVVRRIFKLYLEGYGKIRIAAILNEEGIVCPSEYKKINGENYKNGNRLNSTSYWTYSTINRILRNELYIGNMVQGRKRQSMRGKPKVKAQEEWIVVEGTHEPVIDKETWNKTQDLLKRRTRTLDLNRNQSIFAGFLKCADCGRSLVKKSGKETVRYYCGTYVRSGRQYCTPHAISHEALEQVILEDLEKILEGADKIKIADAVKQSCQTFIEEGSSEEERRRWNLELIKVRKLKKMVYEDYRGGLLSQEEFRIYQQDYREKENLLTRQIESVEKLQEKHGRKIKEYPWMRHLLETGTFKELDRNIVTEMIQEIKVYEGNRIKIAYQFEKER
ncbi:MAG: recombinase family protein [Lachnospiraceae bacterium]|nr:recombinase family protein [Lachnospiraceae bacterium]